MKQDYEFPLQVPSNIMYFFSCQPEFFCWLLTQVKERLKKSYSLDDRLFTQLCHYFGTDKEKGAIKRNYIW